MAGLGNTGNWGDAWLDALATGALVRSGAIGADGDSDKRAAFDPESAHRPRLSVDELVLEPGRLAASVQQGRFNVSLEIEPFDDSTWDNLMDRVMDQPRSAALLLSGEVPDNLAEVLLPGEGELTTTCSCEASRLCRHAAALCFQAAELLGSDPFALLGLRGRDRAQVLTELRRRRAEQQGVASPIETVSSRPRGQDRGVPAARAYRRTRSASSASSKRALSSESEGIELPSIPIPTRARTTFRLAAAPPSDSGIAEPELAELVADGARRAVAVLAGEADSALALAPGADAARRAITGNVDAIAAATKLPAQELEAAAHAFRHGGPAGIVAARQRWDPEPEALEPGIEALQTHLKLSTASNSTSNSNSNSSEQIKVVARANTVSAGSVQLCLDQNQSWWRFEAGDLGWLIVAPPATDPIDLI